MLHENGVGLGLQGSLMPAHRRRLGRSATVPLLDGSHTTLLTGGRRRVCSAPAVRKPR